MKIAVGADHGGYELKEKIVGLLHSLGHVVEDVGCHSLESVDYPDYADRVVALVAVGIASGECSSAARESACPLPPTGQEDPCRQLS